MSHVETSSVRCTESFPAVERGRCHMWKPSCQDPLFVRGLVSTCDIVPRYPAEIPRCARDSLLTHVTSSPQPIFIERLVAVTRWTTIVIAVGRKPSNVTSS